MEMTLEQGRAVLHGKPIPLAEECATVPGCTRLLERVSARINSVDREAGVLKDVKVLGYESANGRTYSREAVAKARGMYEGRPCNINHGHRGASGDRAVSDRFGMLRNVRAVESGLIADLHYLKSHALAPVVIEAAERMPNAFGLSHNVEGRVRSERGKSIVDEIVKVHSVDLVSDPATTKSLFEGRLPDDEDKIVKPSNRDPSAFLDKKQLVNGIMRDESPTQGTDPITVPDRQTEQQRSIRAAFAKSIAAAAVDPLMTPAERKQAVNALLAAMESALAVAGEPRKPVPVGNEAAVAESRRLPIDTSNLQEVAGFLQRRSR